MPSGDDLSNFWGVLGLSGGALIGAIPVGPGWPRRILLAVGAVLGVAAASLWFRPAPGDWVPFWPAITPVATMTFVAVVLGALRTHEKHAAQPVPKQEREPRQPGGRPDARLVKVFEYVHKSSRWAEAHKATGPDVLREIRDKLSLRVLSAWGRREPDTPIERIPWQQWGALLLNPGTGGAQTDAGAMVWHDVQFDMGDVYRLWPHPRSWMAR